MALDGFVRCTCARENKGKSYLSSPRSSSPRVPLSLHRRGSQLVGRRVGIGERQPQVQTCKHNGFLASEFLGNITRIENVRNFLRGLQGKPGPRFPILLKRVVYDGTHCGDWIPASLSPALLKEVKLVLASKDILTPGEREFFQNMRRLCAASLATCNPIVF
jgi:hypothetical protein